MLDLALQFVADELNAYLKAKTGLTDTVVIPGQVIDDNGKYALAKESVALTLINLEQEATSRQQVPDTHYINGKTVSLPPELRLNLYVMFTARFSMYDQALKYLSHILNFCQSRPVFSPDSYSALHDSIKRLSLDLQSPNYDQINQIWAFLGGKHLPSAMYKMRVVSLQDVDAPQIGPPVLAVHNNLHSL